MLTIDVVSYAAETGLTTMSKAMVFDEGASKDITVACVLESGSPVSGACLEITLDDIADIEADTATWIASPFGHHTESGMESLPGPITGLRLNVADAIWSLKVLRGRD